RWLAGVLAAGMLFLAGCGGGTTENGRAHAPAALHNRASQEKIKEQDEKNRFYPAVLTTRQGATAGWANISDAPHTVTSDSGTLLASSTVTPSGGTFRFTFTQPGTYHYHCTIHPSMQGTIVVTG